MLVRKEQINPCEHSFKHCTTCPSPTKESREGHRGGGRQVCLGGTVRRRDSVLKLFWSPCGPQEWARRRLGVTV